MERTSLLILAIILTTVVILDIFYAIQFYNADIDTETHTTIIETNARLAIIMILNQTLLMAILIVLMSRRVVVLRQDRGE